MADILWSIRATDLGEFIRYKSCERRFRLAYNNRALARQLPYAARLFAGLDPVLQAHGKKREAEWEHYLQKLGLENLVQTQNAETEAQSVQWDDFLDMLSKLGRDKNAYVRELSVKGSFGSFHVEGRIDFAIILWRNGKPKLRLVECKASRRDQTYHRAQLSIYKLMVSQLVANTGRVPVGRFDFGQNDIECVVARIDEETNKNQAFLELPSFDLSMMEEDVLLMLAPDGALSTILEKELAALDYQFEAKCDDCVFNIHCLPESARERKLQLLACDPATTRSIEEEGIKTLDELAKLDLNSQQADNINKSANFSGSLQFLQSKARARLSSLPSNTEAAEPVHFLSYRVFSQLPEHDCMGQSLIRIYICVDYDYSENRIAAITAHVTNSGGFLHTPWNDDTPIADVIERVGISTEDELASCNIEWKDSELNGIDISAHIEKEWTGVYAWDTASEKEMLEQFFQGLVEAIVKVNKGKAHAPIHFYVWGRNEISRLVEACSRSSSELLGHLQQLFGCRESLEQLIYSCLQDEVNNRFGLAWTGRGLLVASSLDWYGWKFHWKRTVNGERVALDEKFRQDMFDFTEELNFAQGQWLNDADVAADKHRFELRSQFKDSLPMGYLHAYWGSLANLESNTSKTARSVIENYRGAESPELLTEFLIARVHALRWIEERIDKKSSALQKPPMFLKDLPKFSLGIDHPAKASIDFLRLDFHIKFTDWLAEHLHAPVERVSSGRTIPVRDVRAKNGKLFAKIDLEGYGISTEDLSARSSIETGSFIRLSPCEADPATSQSLLQFGRQGVTAIIESLDWKTQVVEMSPFSMQGDRYRLPSRQIDRYSDSLIFKYATIDESPSDFVSTRVEQRLLSKIGRHAYDWFDRTKPQIPHAEQLTDIELQSLKKMVRHFKPTGTSELAVDQANAILIGLNSTVQLLQGPPGTGKTTTTAAAILARVLAKKQKTTVVVSATTHTAIDTLLQRIADIESPMRTEAAENGFELKQLKIVKVGSESETNEPGNVINSAKADKSTWQKLSLLQKDSILILGGTVGSLLKMGLDPEFRADLLIIDEASMMVFPHFLSLATLVRASGKIMLAGDHRQLSPILAHDWEREDRPPSVIYQPYVSAYSAIKDIAEVTDREQVTTSALQMTFRLPDEIRLLIARLYKLDEVELHGTTGSSLTSKRLSQNKGGGAAQGVRAAEQATEHATEQATARETRATLIGSNLIELTSDQEFFQTVWQKETGLYLLSHTERESKQSNELEIKLIEELLRSANLPPASVAIVTPHRAQRAMLQTRLSKFSSTVDLIDTVERLQGGERPNIIFSATVSDQAAIADNVEFILNLNRSNVAFSRAKQRLIVLCSQTLMNFVPSVLEQYEETLLWKSLRQVCSKLVGSTRIAGHRIDLLKPQDFC